MNDRQQSLNQWLTEYFQSSDFTITTASADASFRAYYRVAFKDNTYIVMDAPPEYEDCCAFIDITGRLLACQSNVPEILHHDKQQGFLLLTDFGDSHYLASINTDNADKLYQQAIDSLIQFQLNADCTGLSDYDQNLLQREMDLFPDWFLQRYLDLQLSEHEKESMADLFKLLIKEATLQSQTFVHRDYHSRNLMLTKANSPGILDYQDAVKGPITYDLVSLLKDSYINWPEDKRLQWVNYYLQQLESKSPLAFQTDEFIRWFDLMGVQRELKVAGIFARLYLRDDKHGYLQHIPPTLHYILELQDKYPELDWLCNYLNETVMPALENKL